MKFNWNEKEPVYVQLKNQICQMILDGDLQENEELPSERQITAEYKLNPSIVAKTWQYLLSKGIITKNANGSMVISKTARNSVLKDSQKEFLNIEWPQVKIKIKNLKIDVEVLTNTL